MQGTYPVIFLSFANIKEKDYASTCYRICQLLMKLYEKNSFLTESGCLSADEVNYYNMMKARMGEKDAPMALHLEIIVIYIIPGQSLIFWIRVK